MADQQEFLEPEEMFNPLDAPVNEKSYTRPNVTFDQSEINTPIPEPVFTPPPMDSKKAEEKKEKKPIEPFNEELNDLPNKDKSMSSEMMATMILDGYATIFKFVEQSLAISDKKIRKLELDGEIDMNISIPFPNGVQITLREFVDDFNQQTVGTLEVTEDFKKEVKPVLIRVLQKKGIGLTDEQMLIYMFSKDIITKGVQIYALKSMVGEMMEMMKQQTLQYKSYNVPPPPAAAAQTSQQPYNPPPPPPAYTPTEVANDYEFEQEDFSDEGEDDMPDWSPAPTANDIVNQMTNPEGLGMEKPKKKNTKRIK
jgi:hypothetical protein